MNVVFVSGYGNLRERILSVDSQPDSYHINIYTYLIYVYIYIYYYYYEFES